MSGSIDQPFDDPRSLRSAPRSLSRRLRYAANFARASWRLIRWLGPWTQASQAPGGVECRHLFVTGTTHRTVEAFVYVPTDRPPIGSYVVAHGLNPHGPSDKRCDRFARVLSHAGFIVMCPSLSALTQMRINATAVDELSSGLEALVELPEHPHRILPGLFSISFGSHPALMAAASPRVNHLIGSVVVFGGYANFVDTCRFMMGTGPPLPGGPDPDPTCMAGLAINTAEVLFEARDAQLLTLAWRTFVLRVWGASEMRKPERFTEVAWELAGSLPAHLAQTFVQGCGVTPGFSERVEEALRRTDTAAMDPRGQLHTLHCPVYLFHGRHDDVIPYTQMHALAAVMPKANPKTYLTGLFHHAGTDPRTATLSRLPLLLNEVRTMAGMVWAIVVSGTRPAIS